ncbi:helix-turn-helix domain-containing protein [Priestia filamentosa]|uniref:helix-turn-helix domain-containing protein n=1 Tax=Priestia filamentosa TaxID=1402861 RepID=UPI003857856D
MDQNMLTIQQVFKSAQKHHLASHIKTVYRWIDKKTLPSIKQGKLRMVLQQEWEAFVANKTFSTPVENKEEQQLRDRIKQLEQYIHKQDLEINKIKNQVQHPVLEQDTSKTAMNRYELQNLLITNNDMDAPDWNMVKNTYNAEVIGEVNGQPVYLFNKIFDRKFNPVEENIFISQMMPSGYVPMHIHQYIELIYVYQGQCTVLLQNGEIDITNGGLIMIDKQTPHTVKEISNSDIVIEMKLMHDYLSSGFISLFTNKSIISQFLMASIIDNRRENHYLYFPFEEHSDIMGIMERIIYEYFKKDFCSADMINGYLFVLFTELIRHNNSYISTQTNDINQKDAIVLDILKYIEEHYKSCSLTELANHFRYHPNYISALLKKATGKSFNDLLHIQRLNKAALYLSNSNFPIHEIAEEIGYSSLSFFYKKFKEIFFQTPKEYRNQHSKENLQMNYRPNKPVI